MTLSERLFGDSSHAGPFGFDYESSAHAVLFYLDENFLLNVLCEFISASLKAGNGALVIATASHQKALIEKLSQGGMDVGALKSKGSYVAIDANEVLSKFEGDGNPDLAQLNRLMSGAIAGISKTLQPAGKRVTVFGELVALMWERRQFEAVLAVEDFWERLASSLPFTLLCGYPITEFSAPGTEEAFVRICGTHSMLIPPDSYSTPLAERRLLEATARSYSNSRLMEAAEETPG